MKVKSGTYHVTQGKLNGSVGKGREKSMRRKIFTYQAGDEVRPEHESQLLEQGAILDGDKPVEAKSSGKSKKKDSASKKSGKK